MPRFNPAQHPEIMESTRSILELIDNGQFFTGELAQLLVLLNELYPEDQNQVNQIFSEFLQCFIFYICKEIASEQNKKELAKNLIENINENYGPEIFNVASINPEEDHISLWVDEEEGNTVFSGLLLAGDVDIAEMIFQWIVDYYGVNKTLFEEFISKITPRLEDHAPFLMKIAIATQSEIGVRWILNTIKELSGDDFKYFLLGPAWLTLAAKKNNIAIFDQFLEAGRQSLHNEGLSTFISRCSPLLFVLKNYGEARRHRDLAMSEMEEGEIESVAAMRADEAKEMVSRWEAVTQDLLNFSNEKGLQTILSSVDDHGDNALHLTSRMGSENMTQLLIEKAEFCWEFERIVFQAGFLHKKNNDGQTPLDAALDGNQRGTFDILRKKKANYSLDRVTKCLFLSGQEKLELVNEKDKRCQILNIGTQKRKYPLSQTMSYTSHTNLFVQRPAPKRHVVVKHPQKRKATSPSF